jgi:hypothetical protein
MVSVASFLLCIGFIQLCGILLILQRIVSGHFREYLAFNFQLVFNLVDSEFVYFFGCFLILSTQ